MYPFCFSFPVGVGLKHPAVVPSVSGPPAMVWSHMRGWLILKKTKCTLFGCKCTEADLWVGHFKSR